LGRTLAVRAAAIASWRSRFGDHLRAQRQERGLTQEALAELAGVDRKLIYRTELGQTSPRLDAVVLIADALGTALTDLLNAPKRAKR
jgi:transcriptional regulator with XRE-family HTH domain